METGIKVGDCMTTKLVTISGKASIIDAARKMNECDVGSLLVTDSKQKIYAIATESDLVRKALSTGNLNHEIKDVASFPLLTVPATSDVSQAAKLMGKKSIKRLIVVSAGKIAGIISSKDIVRISPSLYDLIAEQQRIKAEIPA
ncbi:MAG: cyclic nucleotide-binding/CBS domain-containing protein [Candidatus Micrarchaeia archaeon]